MLQTMSSPPNSIPGSPAQAPKSRSRPSLSIDLSNIPSTNPSPPTNTLLITELNNLILFQPSSLDQIRAQLTAIAPLNSFSPLPSLRRIVCSFLSATDALTVRKTLEGTSLLNHVMPKIYFGEHTSLQEEGPKLLQAPQSDKLFFISPPPSPPHGWMMRNEDPPNKEVHAHDLAHALSMLRTDQPEPMNVDTATPTSISEGKRTPSWPLASRSRSSTVIYHPEDHGHSPNLPAVMVEDVSVVVDDEDVDMDADMSPIEMDMSVKKMPPKTSRPPVELME